MGLVCHGNEGGSLSHDVDRLGFAGTKAAMLMPLTLRSTAFPDRGDDIASRLLHALPSPGEEDAM